MKYGSRPKRISKCSLKNKRSIGVKPAINPEVGRLELEVKIREVAFLVLEDDKLSEATLKVVDSFLGSK